MKKLLCMMLSAILLLSSFSLDAVAGDGDVTAPVIKSLIIENAGAITIDEDGEGIYVTLDLVEDGIGVESLYLDFESSTGELAYASYSARYGFLFTGKQRISVPVSSSFRVGETYSLKYVSISDGLGNYQSYNVINDSTISKNFTSKIFIKKNDCTIDTQSTDKTPPILNSIKIQNADNLDASKNIMADIDITEAGAGLAWMVLSFRNIETCELINICFKDFQKLNTGKHTVTFNTGDFKKGKYKLTEVYLEDYGDNKITYNEDSSNWQKFSQTVTITKIVIPPVLKYFKIKKTDIVSPDFIEIELDIQQGSSRLKKTQLDLNYTQNDTSGMCFHEKIKPISGKQTIKMPIDMFCRAGVWRVTFFVIFTEDGMSYSFNDGANPFYADEKDSWLSNIPGCTEQNVQIHNLYDPVFIGSLDNEEKALKEIKAMKPGETVLLDCRNRVIAPKRFFTAIAGQDKTIIFQDNDVQWIFNGKKISKSRCKDIWLMSSIKVRSGKSAGYPDEKKVVQVHFADNGLLPGEATIRINNEYLKQKYIKDDDRLILSYYDNGSTEVLDKDVALAADGYAEIKVTHNSDYILSHTMPRLVSPTNVKIASNGYIIKLSWSKVAGAAGYKIYRSESAKGTYKKIATVKGNKNITYTDKTVKPNRKYYYRICGYCTGKKVKAAYSKCVSKKAASGQTVGVTAKRLSWSQTKISWKKVEGAAGYKVYYATSKNGTYKLLKATKTTSLNTGRVKKGYYIKVKAYKKVDKKTYYGKFSAAVKI